MAYIIDRYIEATGKPDVNALNITLSYDLGGMCYATYQQKPRGFYLGVTPVEYSCVNGMRTVGMTIFTGTRMLLLPCSRKTKRMESEAKQLMAENLETLVEYVCADQGVFVTEEGRRQLREVLEFAA